MTRILLRLANAPLLLLLACLLIPIESTLFIEFPLNWLQPDLLLPLVIWVALKREFIEGGTLALILGYLLELHSSAPRGTFLSSTMAVFLGVQAASRLLVFPDHGAWIRLTMAASAASRLVGLGVLAGLVKADLQWRHTLVHLFPGMVTTGIAAGWIYRLLDRLDRATHRDLRLEQRLTDDLQLVENEGI